MTKLKLAFKYFSLIKNALDVDMLLFKLKAMCCIPNNNKALCFVVS